MLRRIDENGGWFIPEKVSNVIAAEHEGDWYTVIIMDNGINMKNKAASRMMNSFIMRHLLESSAKPNARSLMSTAPL